MRHRKGFLRLTQLPARPPKGYLLCQHDDLALEARHKPCLLFHGCTMVLQLSQAVPQRVCFTLQRLHVGQALCLLSDLPFCAIDLQMHPDGLRLQQPLQRFMVIPLLTLSCLAIPL